MVYTFTEYQLVGLNCPYFTGIKKHGQKLVLTLDSDTKDIFKTYDDTVSMHIHKDKTIYLTSLKYNWGLEEWEEKIILDLTGNQKVINNLDETFRDKPLYRSSSFPHRVSTAKDWFGSLMICDSLDSLIGFLKNY